MEVAVVGICLSIDNWVSVETAVPLSAVWATAVSYVSVVVAGKDLIWWLKRKGNPTDVKG
jgi:hypothetical protein